jgi:guanylate kinase
MGKLFFLLGKSASGKDTVYKRLMDDTALPLKPVVLYTTRPIREGEKEGVEYHFVTREAMEDIERTGKIIERRTYHTIQGDWDYFTADDGQIDLEQYHYMMLGVPTSCRSMQRYFGQDRVVPLYLYLEDGERLKRAIAREQAREIPQYEEMCRRFLADAKDYREEILSGLNIEKSFQNQELETCIEEIKEEILRFVNEPICDIM